MKKIAIITARGGSKRIPRKNIRSFLGKPIMAYSIEAALQSGVFDEVMVSTEDEEIKEIALWYGATVPFLRSEEMSNDWASTVDVLSEVVDRYASLGKRFDVICCIYPTAPFISAARLRQADKILGEGQADALLPVVRFGFPPQRGMVVEKGRIRYRYPEFQNTRSQDLEPLYHDCGQFYFCKTEAFLKFRTMIPENTVPMELPEEEVQDIDNLSDWEMAEQKYKMLMLKEGNGNVPLV